MKKEMYRQGDILFVRREHSYADFSRHESDRLEVAQGEATGHHHVLVSPEIHYSKFGEMVNGLSLPIGGRVEHEEHAPIELPPGQYEVIRQREYRSEFRTTDVTD